MQNNDSDKKNITPIHTLSMTGVSKLHEAANDNAVYMEFLKFHGRIFKHATNVALEFFAQKPDVQFIATMQQWNNANCTIAQGSEAIRFVDKSGNHIDYYDFSQVEETIPPSIWTINANNVKKLKAELKIPDNSSLINGVINKTMNPAHITDCMKALNVPPNEYGDFKKSYINAVQIMIAGRLEVGGSRFNISPDMSAMSLLKTDAQKLYFFSYVARSAREALMKIENIMQSETIKERNEINEIRNMDESQRRGKDANPGQRPTGDTSGTAEERFITPATKYR